MLDYAAQLTSGSRRPRPGRRGQAVAPKLDARHALVSTWMLPSRSVRNDWDNVLSGEKYVYEGSRADGAEFSNRFVPSVW